MVVVSGRLQRVLGPAAARGPVVPKPTIRIAGHVGAVHGGFGHAVLPYTGLNGEN